MTAPLSEQEIAEGERYLQHASRPDATDAFERTNLEHWLVIRAKRIFATIRADRARIAELERQLAERTRERDEAQRFRQIAETIQGRLNIRLGQVEAERDAAVRRAGAAGRDAGRLDHLLRAFFYADGAWMASHCFDIHKDGLRAAIDAAMSGEEKPNANLP